ncbi:MAG: putative DNA binding domain-containing protein [candidate division Zixibacteria bacterium]|nr:putative DNA binding domain-containing protein [candidate division Zixibacteria bacterium]
MPRELFDKPDVAKFADRYFESQVFERKRGFTAERTAATISAFANVNPDGGLIVMGIEDDGRVSGIFQFGRGWVSHVQKSLNGIIPVANISVKTTPCLNAGGAPDEILLIHAAFSSSRVVEVSDGRAFKRIGEETIELSEDEKRELRISKGELEYEREPVTEYNPELLDSHLVDDFLHRIKARDSLSLEVSAEDVLLNRRLITRREGKLWITIAGALLFYKDPCNIIPGARVRFLRFQGTEELFGSESNIIKDSYFEGPLARQIAKLQEFLRTQIREFSYLNEDGRFVTEAEYPEFAWLEALVNAIAHRSYNLKYANIFVKMFDDKLVIESPGSFPGVVSASNLIHYPRNPVIMDALRYMGYVKAAREGTRRMYQEMERMELPPPEFKGESSQVVVILYNNMAEREKKRSKTKEPISYEVGNLFRMQIDESKGTLDETESKIREEFIKKLMANGWVLSPFRTSAHSIKKELKAIEVKGTLVCSIRKGFRFSFKRYKDTLFLAIDPKVQLVNHLTLKQILEIVPDIRSVLPRYKIQAFDVDKDAHLTILGLKNDKMAKVTIDQKVFEFPTDELVPALPADLTQLVLKEASSTVDIRKEIARYANLTVTDAPRKRFTDTIELANELAAKIFPLKIDGTTIYMKPEPANLTLPVFYVNRDLREPAATFDPQGTKKEREILSGLVKFGSYEKPDATISLISLVTPSQSKNMNRLVGQIVKGSFKFAGMERAFSTKITAEKVITTKSPDDYLAACKGEVPRLDENKIYMFLAYCPEGTYSREDYSAPYYTVKKFLLENGILSQMVDEDTLNNPKFKDFNLALDIFAKSGFIPWVLADGLPDVDLIVGLSYSSISGIEKPNRVIGYVNVFDPFGRWQFYRGSSKAFSYEERKKYFSKLVVETVEEIQKDRNIKKVHIHVSFKLSREIKEEIYNQLAAIIPGISIHFVWINQGHTIRFFDTNPTGTGSFQRGLYVVTSKDQFFIATTGENELNQQSLGTPKLLEVNVSSLPRERYPDLKTIAFHVLSLTKLNWASTKSFCREPITIKFASDIAYLMNAFLMSSESFVLNKKLEKKPWFL